MSWVVVFHVARHASHSISCLCSNYTICQFQFYFCDCSQKYIIIYHFKFSHAGTQFLGFFEFSYKFQFLQEKFYYSSKINLGNKKLLRENHVMFQTSITVMTFLLLLHRHFAFKSCMHMHVLIESHAWI